MTQQYFLLERINKDGVWEVLDESSDPLELSAQAIKVSLSGKSSRTTALYGADAEAYKALKRGPAEPVKQSAQWPSVGRIVHYYQGSTNTVLPAIVQAVGPIDDTGMPRLKLKVFWLDREDPLPLDCMRGYSADYASGCWTWPPRA